MGKEIVLITGANKGIGLALVKEYLNRGEMVIGTCRQSSPELEQTEAHIISGIEVTHPLNLKEKVEQLLAGEKITILINCAGVLHQGPQGHLLRDEDLAQIRQQFEVNTLGPILVTNALLPQMTTGGKIAMITSRMGSISDNTSGGYYGYRASKAALNAYGKSISIDLKPLKIAVGLIHPGFVKTAMTGGQGEITPEIAASGIVKRIDELNLESSGYFRHSNGANLHW